MKSFLFSEKKKLGILSLLLLITGLIGISIVKGATDDSATGSFTVDSVPDLTNTNFVNGTDFSLVSTLIPDNSELYGVNFTLTHSGTIDDILNVTVWIYDDSVHGSDYQTASPNGLQLIRAVWVEDTSAWTVAQGSFSEWTESSSIDPAADSALTTFDFVLIFDISRAARADTDWNVTVGVFDDDDDTDYDTEAGLVSMAEYYAITFSSSTFSWGSVQTSSVNNTHGALSVSIYANAQWELLVNGTDFNDTTDIEGNNIVAWDLDGSNGGDSFWLRNTIATGLSTWDNQVAMSDETPLTRNNFYFLSTGVLFTEGNAYELTVTVYIQANV
jgi:hypothetical protein